MARGETYEEFVQKFIPKKTTDDCYTPPKIYEAIKNYVINRWSLQDREIVRPFYPGGDYKNYEYPKNCVVIDNPPFSILAEIKSFYHKKGIEFFLFAPHLTLFSVNDNSKFIVVGEKIAYENGAKIPTSYTHNLSGHKIETSTELRQIIKKIQNKKDQLCYGYPKELVTISKLGKLMVRGIDIYFDDDELYFVRKLDKQKEHKKTVFGAGFLTSKNFEHYSTKNISHVFELSEREKEIIKKLRQGASNEDK